jgi:predicted lipoprotein with Yx(FWY)xxD motif
MKRTVSLGFGLALVLALAACGGSSHSAAPQGGVAGTHHMKTTAVATRQIHGLGTVLVDSQGMTLYAFAPDRHQRVTCTGSCASVWHALMTPGTQKPTVAGAATASLLGADMSPSGGHVVTYAGWPLYTYVGDTGPGQANGQGLNANGGVWYVVSPSGSVIHSKMSGTTGSTTTSGGGGGSTWG